MQKKELLAAIRERNTEKLVDFLLQTDLVLLENYYNLSQNKQSHIWVGDYIYHLYLNIKITEEDLMFLFKLSDSKGLRWLDYLSHKNSKVCLPFLNLLQNLVSKHKFSLSNLSELLFESAPDGWTLLMSVAKYHSNCQDELLSLINSLNSKEQIATLIQSFQIPIQEQWCFLHCVAYYQKDTVFIAYLKLLMSWMEAEFITPKDILELLSLTPSGHLTIIELLFQSNNKTQCLSTILIVLGDIYEKDKELLPEIIGLLKKQVGSVSMLKKFLIQVSASDVTLFFKKIQSKDNRTLPLILSAFVDGANADQNCFHTLAMSKTSGHALLNIFFIDWISEYISQDSLIEHRDILVNLLANIFLRKSTTGYHFIHLLFQTQMTTQLTSAIYSILLFLCANQTSQEDLSQLLFSDTKEGWNLFHLAMRYQNEDINKNLFEFLNHLLPKQEQFIALVDGLLNYDEKKPFYLYLLFMRKNQTLWQVFYNKIRPVVLKDRSLSLKMLEGILNCLIADKAEKLSLVADYVTDLLEQNILFNFDTLSEAEVICLEKYSSAVGFRTANYILHQYLLFKNPKEKPRKDLLDSAYSKGYDLAEIVKCASELRGQFSLSDNFEQIFKKYFSHIKTPSGLMQYLIKRNFIDDNDYVIILNAAIKYFKKNLDVIYHAMGKFYYDQNVPGKDIEKENIIKFNQSKEYFSKLDFEIPQLIDADTYYELSIVYSHFYDSSKLIGDFYFSNRYYQLACMLGFKDSDDPHREILDPILALFPHLRAFQELESKLDKLQESELKSLFNQVRRLIVKEFICGAAKPCQEKILRVSKMLTNWLQLQDLSIIEKEFSEFLASTKEKNSPNFFNLFSPTPEIDKSVHKLYEYFKKTLAASSSNAISSEKTTATENQI